MTARARGLLRGGRLPAVLAASALVVVGCGSGDSDDSGAEPAELSQAEGDPLEPQPLDERTTITVASGTNLEVYAQLILAQELGEFEAENLEVVVEALPPADAIGLLSQGQIDAYYGAVNAGLFNLQASGAPVRIAFPGAGYSAEAEQGFWYRTDAFGEDGVQVEELEGEAIMTPSGAGSISSYYFWKWANSEDDSISPTDLTFEPVPPNDAALALTNGARTIGNAVSPQSQIVGDDGCCAFVDVGYPEYPTIGWITGNNLLNTNPDAGLAFFRALARVTSEHLQGAYHDDPEVAQILADALGVPLEQFAELPELIFDPELPLGMENLDSQAYYREHGLVTYAEDLGAEQVYDTRFVEALAGDGSE